MSDDGQDKASIESRLLDLHFRQLDPDEGAEVEAAIADSPELAAKSRAIRDLCTLLDTVSVPEPPADLAQSVMTAVEEQAAPLPFREPASAVPAGTTHDLSAIPVLSLRELVAIAACITLFVGIFVPGYFKARNFAQRNYCLEHLRKMGTGMATYAEDHNGYLAQAGFVPGGSWLRTTTPGVPRVSNTRPLYLLRRYNYVTEARVFICPATARKRKGNVRPMIVDDYTKFNDFVEPANVTYSPIFMNLPKGRQLEKMPLRMVLVADRNPLFDEQAPHVMSPYDESFANSRAHDDDNGAGQCVLFADGKTLWATKPTVGVAGDNIYLAGERWLYEGIERPLFETDTFCVP